MAFLANLFAARFSRALLTPAFIGLSAVLVAGYFVASHGSISVAAFLPKLMLVALIASPLFFSGLVFSTLIKGTSNISEAMAYNLIGAMLGGMLEYNSMRFGFSSLYLIALLLYGLAWAAVVSERLPREWFSLKHAALGGENDPPALEPLPEFPRIAEEPQA
jgi:hypothetical protein